MKLVFKRIPRTSIICYLIGFITITIALINYWNSEPFISEVRMLQVFLAGAIVVAIGSVINTLYQFKPGQD